MKKTFFGVELDDITESELDQTISTFLNEGQHQICTTNPEFVVMAQHDDDFLNTLNSCDLNIVDGFGVILLSKLIGQGGYSRITGNDLVVKLCNQAEKKNQSVFVLGGLPGIAEKAATKIRQMFPGLVVGSLEGGQMKNKKGEALMDDSVFPKINVTNPSVLFVALNYGKQERWIKENLYKMPSVRIAVGFGGAIDYLAGTVKRAPVFIQSLGLEWLWRVIKEPSRLPRIFTATFIFTYLVLKNKFIK